MTKQAGNLIKHAAEARAKRLGFLLPSREGTHNNGSNNLFFDRLKGLPFYDWSGKGNESFNSVIGLPIKDNQSLPLFDYEKTIHDLLLVKKVKHLWILKSTGLGISELCLRLLAYLCLRDDAMRGKQMCIVTGPRIELSITLIDRIKRLFPGVIFNSKDTVVELNGCHVEAYPSHHLDAMRGLTDVKLILLDEADFFPPGEQQDARDVSERYVGKTDPYIIMVSTPNMPGGLFERIDKEEPSLYTKLRYDYRVGLGKIYTDDEIERARRSPSFDREYDLKYSGLIGNLLSPSVVDRAVELAKQFAARPYNFYAPASLGIDPAFGSSKFAFVLTQVIDTKIQVVYASEFERPDFNEMINRAINLVRKYYVQKVYVDASNPAIITSLKQQLGDRVDYDRQLQEIKQGGYWEYKDRYMKVVPVPFNVNARLMISQLKLMMESNKIAIDGEKFRSLIIALKTAQMREGERYSKESPFDDLFDAFILSLCYYQIADPNLLDEVGRNNSGTVVSKY